MATSTSFKWDSEVASDLICGEPVRDPFVSIAIPTFNRPDYLAEALETAFRQRCSKPIEIIVVDNGDLKETEEVVRRYPADRVCLYRNRKNLGMGGNWNRGIELSRGKWISVLHDDDWLEEGWLEALEPGMENAKVGLLFTPVIDCGGTKEAVTGRQPLRAAEGSWTEITDEVWLHECCIRYPGNLFLRELAIEVGGFRPTFRLTVDWDFWMRVHLKGGSRCMNRYLVRYRQADFGAKESTLGRRSGLSAILIPVQWKRNLKHWERARGRSLSREEFLAHLRIERVKCAGHSFSCVARYMNGARRMLGRYYLGVRSYLPLSSPMNWVRRFMPLFGINWIRSRRGLPPLLR